MSKENEEEIIILVCSERDDALAAKNTQMGWETAFGECRDCGVEVMRRPDPEVPEDAVKLCMSCAKKHMSKDGEAEIRTTQQNKEVLGDLTPYVCAACGEIFLSGRSNEEALAELEKDHPGATPEECAVVCSDCYEKVLAWEAALRGSRPSHD